MQNENIKFYVIIPVYKTEEYIAACIESVLNQTYGNFHIIAVDDGSPDHAGLICDDYGVKDDRITVIHKENGGQISARHEGIKLAKQSADEKDYFVFLDSDDTLTPDALEVIFNTVNAKGSDIVFFQYNKIVDGCVRDGANSAWFVGDVHDKRELYKIVLKDPKYNSMCIKAMRNNMVDVIDYSEFYGVRFGEDLLHSLSIYKKCRFASFIDKRLYNYTTNPSSVTRLQFYQNYKVDSTVRNAVWQFVQSENCFTEEDLEDYLAFAGELLKNEIIRILNFDAENRKKKEWLNSIRNDDYFVMLLKKSKDGRMVCVKNGCFGIIIFAYNVKNLLRKIYHFLRRR